MTPKLPDQPITCLKSKAAAATLLLVLYSMWLKRGKQQEPTFFTWLRGKRRVFFSNYVPWYFLPVHKNTLRLRRVIIIDGASYSQILALLIDQGK